MNYKRIIITVTVIVIAFFAYLHFSNEISHARSNHQRSSAASTCKSIIIALELDQDQKEIIDLKLVSPRVLSDIKEMTKKSHKGFGEIKILIKEKFKRDFKNPELVIVTKDLFNTLEGHPFDNGPKTHVICYSDGTIKYIKENEFSKLNLSEFIELNKLKL